MIKDIDGNKAITSFGNIDSMKVLEEISFLPIGMSPVGYVRYTPAKTDNRFRKQLMTGCYYPIENVKGSFVIIPNVAPVHFSLLSSIVAVKGAELLFEGLKKDSEIRKKYIKEKEKKSIRMKLDIEKSIKEVIIAKEKRKIKKEIEENKIKEKKEKKEKKELEQKTTLSCKIKENIKKITKKIKLK